MTLGQQKFYASKMKTKVPSTALDCRQGMSPYARSCIFALKTSSFLVVVAVRSSSRSQRDGLSSLLRFVNFLGLDLICARSITTIQF
mmetsp:Transcript_15950/g.36800  ORF Transcript_15950/g.36800 Transcript_15950/m.36800 type:complete len:87 (-) Transcript_15950:439-699(-)